MLSGGSRVGDYEIEAELGEGGMAKVYRARHALLDTLHAVKVLDSELRGNADARQRFLDEARIQAKHLDHPGIVKVTNIVATAEHAALVMELIEGKSLEESVHELVDDPAEIRRIMLAVLDAVGHAHAQGIVHRDLKPANVLLAGKGRIPKVTDFGIAKVSDPQRAASKKSTHAAARMGTLSYMSPEQIRRAKDVTPRSDIFSLGAMLYELATGALPFEGGDDFDVMEKIVHGRFPPPADKNPRIDPVFVEVIERALRPRPEDRYASCAEMAAALGKKSGLISTGPRAPVAVAHEPAAEPRAPGSGSRLAIALAVAGLAAIGAVLFMVKPGGGDGGNNDLLRPPVAADIAAYRQNLGLTSGALSAVFETTQGTIRCQLYPEKSPLGVAAFVGLAAGLKPWRDGKGMIHTKDHYYDGTGFYRIIPEFVAQVGRQADALATPSDLGFAYDIESNDLKHVAGTLAIANAGANTNGGELVFLVEASPRIDGHETIIGRCKEIDVIRQISRVARDAHDMPEKPITLLRVRIGDEVVFAPETQAAPVKKSKVGMTRYAVPIQNSYTEGRSDAPITIVAYLDAAEVYSGKLFPTLEKIQRDFPDKVRIVWKFHETFPDRAGRLAHLALCAAFLQRKLHDVAHGFWDGKPKYPYTEAMVRAIAVQSGLDPTGYDVSIQSAMCWARVDTDEKLATRLGIGGMPNAFFNGRWVSGAYDYEELELLVAEEITNTRSYEDIVASGEQRLAPRGVRQ